MLGRITSAIIVVFWVGTMGALVRLEFFPQSSGVGDIPPRVVLQKIFTHEEDTRLSVSYRGEQIGFCNIEIEPITAVSDDNQMLTPVDARAAYRVHSEVTLRMGLMGGGSHLRLVGDSRFNRDYEIQAFHLQTRVGEGRVDVQGDAQTNKVRVDFEFGTIRDQRVFDFDQVQGAGLAGMVGLPGLANFSFL